MTGGGGGMEMVDKGRGGWFGERFGRARRGELGEWAELWEWERIGVYVCVE